MPTKRKVIPKKENVASEKPSKPQFVTEVVEEIPVNEGVDVPDEALETIKEKAEEIEEVVKDIQEDLPVGKSGKKEADSEASGDGETEPVALEESVEKKELLEEIFTKDSSPTVYPDITAHTRMGAAPVFLWAVIIIGVALLTGGTLLVVVSGLPKLPTLLAKPTPTPTLAPTPTPTPLTPQRGDIKIQVLNGGGTPGSAGKAKTFLEEKGYTVAATGNTEEYTYKKTEILVKPGKVAYLDLLKADIAGNYTVGSASATLPEDASFDARVIVGKE